MPPNSEKRQSALFHHVNILGLNGLRQLSLQIRTMFRTKDDRGRVLSINQNRKHRLESILNLGTPVDTCERHIRIDKEYYARNCPIAKKSLWYQWHYTERVKFQDSEELIVHVYFHYAKNVAIHVKLAGKQITPLDEQLAKIKENAQDAKDLMAVILKNMTAKIKVLSADFDQEVERIKNLDLKDTTVISQYADLAEQKYMLLQGYLETSGDTRLDDLRIYISRLREIQEAKETSTLATIEQPEASSLSVRKIAPQRKVVDRRPPRKTVSDLKKSFNDLKEGSTTVQTAGQAKIFCDQVQDLLIEAQTAYIETRDKQEELVLKVICNLIRALPSKFDLFMSLLQGLHYDEALLLYDPADIPPTFYVEFLGNISCEILNREQELFMVKFCEVFFERSQDYRMLLSQLHHITVANNTDDKLQIAFSILFACVLTNKLVLFKAILDQNGHGDHYGCAINNFGTTLLEATCKISRDNKVTPFIIELLKYKPMLERPELYAHGMKLSEDSNNSLAIKFLKDSRDLQLFNSASSFTEKSAVTVEEEEAKQSIFSYIRSIIFCHSALPAYCEASYQELSILEELITNSSAMSLVLACASFTFQGITDAIILARNKIGLSIVFDQEESVRRIRDAHQDVVENKNVKYIGFDFLVDIQDAGTIRLLVEKLNITLAEMDDEQIMKLVATLMKNRQILYNSERYLQALICNKAMMMSLVYCESSSGLHAKILSCLKFSGDIYSSQMHNWHLDNTQAKCEYARLETIARCSVYADNLVKLPWLQEHFSAMQRRSSKSSQRYNL